MSGPLVPPVFDVEVSPHPDKPNRWQAMAKWTDHSTESWHIYVTAASSSPTQALRDLADDIDHLEPLPGTEAT
jgi:predicted carbohydrate-binding protein with CBM5 and CBM33 domain